jgi:hypothetical protein
MKRRTWVLLLLAMLLAGCGSGRPALVPVEGTVILDGEPVEGAIVAFQMIDPPPDYRRPSSAITDAAGKFRVQTYQAGDGLPRGRYKVVIVKQEPLQPLGEDFDAETGTVDGRPIQYKEVIPARYGDPETTDLEAEVTPQGLDPSTFTLSSD